jgi:hypothetical protein
VAPLPEPSGFRSGRFASALFAGFGVAPLFPLPFSEFNERYRMSLQPLGASLRLAFVPFGNPAGDADGTYSAFGFELSISWNYLSRKTGAYTASNQLALLHMNLLWQLWLARGKAALNFRFGGGPALLWQVNIDYQGHTERKDVTTWLNSAACGVSLQWYIKKNLFIDFGAAYLHLFSVDNPFLSFIHSYGGIGWRWD